MATIYAWTGALNKRGELDNIPELCAFAKKLEEACIATLKQGKMTKDLVGLWEGGNAQALNTKDFILAIRENLEKIMA